MKDLRFAKLVILINAAVPGTLLLWDATHGRAGANPVNYAILTTGLLALIFLTLSLAVTPLRKLTGLNWLFHFRRMLGLYAFFYALAHFSIFFIFDRSLNVPDTLSEMIKRPYLIVGSLGLLAMVPLAATSFNVMIKRLGPKRWQALHRLAYLAAIAGALHFYIQAKSDVRKPLIFAVIVSLLLAYRLVAFLASRSAASQAPGQTASTAPTTNRWKGTMRVAKIIQETPDTRTFRLVPATAGAPLFSHLPGQYLTLTLDIDGRKVRRNYTIASTPTRPSCCEVTIKRDGLASRHMHDIIKESDTLAVAAPAGQFTFTGTTHQRIALLAAGVGITPIMSILRYLTDQNWPGQIYLVYANKTESDIIFRTEIEALQNKFPTLHVTFTLTRADASTWNSTRGRIDAALLTRLIPNLATLPFYLCGPAEMLTSTRTLLGSLGAPESNIHVESFGTNAPAPADEAPLAANYTGHTVTFSRSNKSTQTTDDRPLLELGEDLGITLESECRSGICGRCKCKMLSGSVAMPTQEALDPADRRNGMILLCQARALEDVILEA